MIASCPSRRRAARLAARLIAVMVTGAAVLGAGSACSAGKITQTATEVAAVPGANVNASPNALIALRDLIIAYGGPQGYPVGASAPLVVRIFNQGEAAVRLVRVNAGDAAQRVVLVNDTRQTTATSPPALPPPSASPSASAGPSASASAGPASPSAAPTPQPSPTPERPAGQESFTVVVPSLGFALLVPGQGPYLQLVGLTRPLIPGQTIAVTFGFDDGSTVTAAIPFGPPATPVPRPSVIEGR